MQPLYYKCIDSIIVCRLKNSLHGICSVTSLYGTSVHQPIPLFSESVCHLNYARRKYQPPNIGRDIVNQFISQLCTMTKYISIIRDRTVTGYQRSKRSSKHAVNDVITQCITALTEAAAAGHSEALCSFTHTRYTLHEHAKTTQQEPRSQFTRHKYLTLSVRNPLTTAAAGCRYGT